MTKLITQERATELIKMHPKDAKYRALLITVLNTADEQAQLDIAARRVAEAITELSEQMDRTTAAEAAQTLNQSIAGINQ